MASRPPATSTSIALSLGDRHRQESISQLDRRRARLRAVRLAGGSPGQQPSVLDRAHARRGGRDPTGARDRRAAGRHQLGEDRWVSRSGMTTPSERTRPQRPARCQNSMCRRMSTRAWWTIAMLTASWRVRRTERANRRPARCGKCRQLTREALVEHRQPGALEDQPVVRQRQRRVGGSPRSERSTSPSPSSSAL